jgi:predicted nuclease with TOPRIM domain
MPDPKNQNDYYHEVSDSIKSIFDLTSRIDERVKNLIKNQEEMDRKLNEHLKTTIEIDGRVKIVEARQHTCPIVPLENTVHQLELSLQQLQIQATGHENKWKTIISFGVQIAWVILAAYLLMKLGIQAPAVP